MKQSGSRPDRPGLREAKRALGKRTGKATDADRPPITPLPGPKRKPVPGQLDVFGREAPPAA